MTLMLRKLLGLIVLIFLAGLAASRLPPAAAPAVSIEPEETAAPAAVSSIGLDSTESIAPPSTATSAALSFESYAVIRVVDGDTIVIDRDGVHETVRLIGVDTPETVHPSKPVQCFGREASDRTKSWLSGARVELEFDPSQGMADKYGRTLAYVRRADGLFVNQALIEQGYAHEYTYRLPYRYRSEFKQAEQAARDSRAGLWAPDACTDVSE